MGCGSSVQQRSDRNSIKINVIEPTSIAPEPSDIEPYSLRRESNGVQTILEEENKMASAARPSMKSYDAMISYHQSDADFVKYFSGELKKNNITVWREDPKDKSKESVSHKGQAIVESKVFIIILSRESASSKTCQDEVALAYISNKSIFPVAMEQFANLSKYLDFGMRLTLAKLNWVFFENQSDREENFPQLLTAIKSELDLEHEPSTLDLTEEAEEPQFKMNFQRQKSQYQVHANEKGDKDFWERSFGNRMEVPWIEFRELFKTEYAENLERDFPEDKVNWLMNLIYKDVLELNKTIDKKMYNSFCGGSQGDPDRFYERLKHYAIGSFAMREVFDMDSTVRLDAVQNLGKSNRKIVQGLIKLLGDEDRLVRESTCLSLGHMHAEDAVPHIVNLWRNDAISHVRNAAELALSLMGADKAREALKMTKVLGDEMKRLENPT
ncbi:uncharacterized protein LOC144449132 isoform X2 [Glandiceps talaboti]